MLIQTNSAPFTKSASNWIEVYTLKENMANWMRAAQHFIY